LWGVGLGFLLECDKKGPVLRQILYV
jgi:hypothetical protein